MRSGDSFVVVIDLDVSGMLERLVGAEPEVLTAYIKGFERIATTEIERSSPDNHENRGELHRAVWFKEDQSSSDLITSIFGLFSGLAQEMKRANKRYIHQGFPPAGFHAGLSQGRVEIRSTGASGEAASRACASAEHARTEKAALMVTSDVLNTVPPELLRRLGVDLSSQSPPDCVAIREDVLERLARRRRRFLSFLALP